VKVSGLNAVFLAAGKFTRQESENRNCQGWNKSKCVISPSHPSLREASRLSSAAVVLSERKHQLLVGKKWHAIML
jgi:hypothetical protein